LGLLLTGAAEQRLGSVPQSICAPSPGSVATVLSRRALGPGLSSTLVDFRTAEFCATVTLACGVACGCGCREYNVFCAIEIVDAQQLASAAGCSRISPRARLFTPFFLACDDSSCCGQG
jgi:hypothetical protein